VYLRVLGVYEAVYVARIISEGRETNLGVLGRALFAVKLWAAEGMRVHREGQFVSTSFDELNAWLGRELGKPAHAVTENTDLTAELRRDSHSFAARSPTCLRRNHLRQQGRHRVSVGGRERRDCSDTPTRLWSNFAQTPIVRFDYAEVAERMW
jgi:hypothetical protein